MSVAEMGCPHCGSMVTAGRAYCAHCGRRVLGWELCSECREPIAAEARYCPYCTQRVRRGRWEVDASATPLHLSARPTRLGGLIHGAGFVRPARIEIDDSGVRIVRHGVFGLGRREESMPLSRVASARWEGGTFWCRIVVEGYDEGERLELGGLRPGDAKHLVFRLKERLSGR